jgi:hypothetical protein
MGIMNTIKFLQMYPQLLSIVPEPEQSTKNVPTWYKDQPAISGSDIPDRGIMRLTVKKCQAFFDAMAMGYILKVPCDIYIDTTDGNLNIQLPAGMNKYHSMLISEHSEEQVSHLPIDKEIYCSKILRIHPTWMVKTNPGYSTFFTSPMHQSPSPLKAIDAVVDTDNYFTDGHLSFLVKKNFKGTLKQGTPMSQVFPFKREEWTMELDNNFPAKKIEEQRSKVRSTFQNGYRLKFWQKKTFK